LSPAELSYIARADLIELWLIHLGLVEERLPVIDMKAQSYLTRMIEKSEREKRRGEEI
jgi:hypothetical protein